MKAEEGCPVMDSNTTPVVHIQRAAQELGVTSSLSPSGLLCELMAHPEKTQLTTSQPHFAWIFRDLEPGAKQTAYQLVVSLSAGPSGALSAESLVWDSGKVDVTAGASMPGVLYGGPALSSHQSYCWRVRSWNSNGQVSPWSEWQCFHMAEISDKHATAGYPLERVEVAPARVVQLGAGHVFIDFGRAAFATLRLTLTSPDPAPTVEVHLGEALEAPSTIRRNPPGTIRYQKIDLALRPGTHTYTLVIPPDKRNTGPQAIRLPASVGEVMPFRYCELVECPGAVAPSCVRQIVSRYCLDREAASFSSSDEALNRVWELCKYTIEATSFCGLYVDGDRERIPYEADAYINQLSHYCVDREYTLARRTHEYLLFHPSWPTEWILHSVLMAWADYEQTGDNRSLQAFYGDLQAKTLSALAREDGLISTADGRLTSSVMDSVHYSCQRREFFGRDLGDIVDWPPAYFTKDGLGERDGYEMTAVNTVVNAFHYRNLVLMGRIAEAVGKPRDAELYAHQATRVSAAFNAVFWDDARRVYLDGENTTHTSLHANMFALAFGLVPPERRASVVEFIKSRGMACSVYGAQYLLEALYQAGEADYALQLMTAEHDRSWIHMLRAGSTMTMEAWDWKYKNNLDWNHAWGAAPANIIPRYLMGVRPLVPGFGRVLIEPQPSGVGQAALRLPTIRGTIGVSLESSARRFVLGVEIPSGVSARVVLPLRADKRLWRVELDGKACASETSGTQFVLDPVVSGRHEIRALAR